jgi:hypothetical protein
MKWWVLFLLAFWDVSAAQALAQSVTVSGFLAGAWVSSCAPTAPSRGITINENGRFIGQEGDWGCVITKMTEVAPHWFDQGPSWVFVARCDQPSEKAVGPGAFAGIVTGRMDLLYRSPDRSGRIELRISVDRPALPGQRGLLSLHPSTLYGPYTRCE